MELLSINISRLHPLLVHLPIGILVFAFLMEGVSRWQKRTDLDTSIRLAILTGTLAAIASVISGLMLAQEGGYDTDQLSTHKWLGIALSGTAILLYFVQFSKLKSIRRLYFPLFGLVLIFLTLTGHFGGTLTHGTGYLFEEAESSHPKIKDLNQAPVYAAIIQPILKEKCVSCHNPSKSKGELIMTTQEGLRAGGETGALFNFSAPLESEILQRIHLPENDEEHMPPNGKTQLAEDEIRLLTWWVKNEACFECLVNSTVGRDQVEDILAKYIATHSMATEIKVKPAKPKTLALLRKQGIKVHELAEGHPLFIVNLANRTDLDQPTMKLLRKIDHNILELDLSNGNFSDTLAPYLRRFKHLRKLQLQNTLISSAGLKYLESLQSLEVLNLYGTEISDEAMESLRLMPALQKVYLWQSKVTKDGMAGLQEEKPSLEIQHTLDASLFGSSQLSKPEIVADQELFLDSVSVKINASFGRAEVLYTTDGSVPDTCALAFRDSIVLKETTTIKAIAYKQGWSISPIEERHFIKAPHLIKNITLAVLPDERYRANGASSLVDLVKGEERFSEGNWLGYQAEHLTATLELEEVQQLSRVYVSALSAPGSWIHFPQGIRIWLSQEGKEYQLVRSLEFPTSEPKVDAELRNFDLSFAPREARFVKVKVISQLQNPAWHVAAGEKCWIFVDEIIVD